MSDPVDEALRLQAMAMQKMARGRQGAAPEMQRPRGADALAAMEEAIQPGAIQPGQFATGGRDITDTVAGDMIASGAAGVVRGAGNLADFPGQAMEAGNVGLARMLGAGPETQDMVRQVTGFMPGNTRGSAAALTDATMPGVRDYQSQTTAGRIAGTVGEFLPGAAAFGGMGAGNLIRYGVVPGAASEVAGMATEGTDMEGPARIAAAIGAPLAVGALERGVRRAITPFPGADPERLSLAKVLDDFDVPITSGQRLGSEGLRRTEGMTRAGQAMSESQREAFTAAALRTAGTQAKRATPDVLRDTAQRIGSVFDDVAKGLDVTPDATLSNRLAQAVQEYQSLAPAASRAPIMSEVLRRVTVAYRSGNPIPASQVSSWRSTLSKMTASSDNATRTAAIDALNALDDAMSGALTAAGRPQDVQRLATAREQWRNFLAIQRAATNAGEGAAAGILSPSALRGAVVSQGRSAYAQGGRGDIGALARAGEGIMRALPNSGTAQNLAALGVPTAAGIGAGSAIGSAFGPAGAALGGVMGAVGPAMGRAAMMTPMMQNYLANQLVGAGPGIVGPGMLGPLTNAFTNTSR
jgi:hypothetical protein